MSGALVLAVADSAVSPGLLGFLVVAALGVATWLLVRSMTRQMKKIDLPDEAGDSHAPRGTDAPGDADGSAHSPDPPAS
jgi:hypothetical protein